MDVSRDFGGVHAVSGVSLAVRRGTLTGLIGPNGAGKSTLLALLAGTDRVSAGQIMYQGQDVTAVPAYRRARLGLVRTFQLASEFKRLTVMENLLSAAPGNRGESLRRRGGRAPVLARGRGRGRREGDRSPAPVRPGGAGQRVRRRPQRRPAAARRDHARADDRSARCCCWTSRWPACIPSWRAGSATALVELCRDGMTILMVEHELAIMDEFCDPVIVMAEGSVLAEGTMAELRDRTEVVEAYLVG